MNRKEAALVRTMCDRRSALAACVLALSFCGRGDLVAQRAASDAQPLQLRRECSIGADEGRRGEVFGLIGSAAVDSGGNMYVVDRQERTVRVYDAGCRYVRSFGRAGSGPGEFSSAPLGIIVEGARVRVLLGRGGFSQGQSDPPSAREAVFTLAGEYVDRPSEDRSAARLCCGFRLVTATASPVIVTTREPPSMSIVLERGTLRDTLAQGPSGIGLMHAAGDPRSTRPLGLYGPRYASYHVSDTLFVVADGYDGALRYYAVSAAGPRARLVRTTQLGVQGLSLTSEHRRQQTDVARRTLGSRAEITLPARWSLAYRIWSDGIRLWLQAADPSSWIVLPILGNQVAQYRTPEGMRVIAITATHIIGVTETAHGAHVLNRYRLPPDLPR